MSAPAPSCPLAKSTREVRTAGFEPSPPNRHGPGLGAIKTTLQKAAIHCDRRDRRRTPYFCDDSAKFRTALQHSSLVMAGLGPAIRVLNLSGPPGPAALTRGFPLSKHCLLKLNLGASLFQGGFDLRRLVLVDALLDRLRSAFDQVLGFFEAQASDGADLFDHFDLLLADGGKNDRKLGLFLGSGGPASSRRSSSYSDRRGRRDAPLLLKQLGQFRRLQHSEAREVVHDFLQISHEIYPSVLTFAMRNFYQAAAPSPL